MQSTLTSATVQAHTASLLRDGLRLKDYGKSCPTSTLLAVLFTACARLSSLFAACNHLRHAPSHETVREALHANLPRLDILERRLNATLGFTISRSLRRSLRRRTQRVAIDLHLRPYHGQPATSPDELVRGKPKSGPPTSTPTPPPTWYSRATASPWPWSTSGLARRWPAS
jgi:hypothetical protein